MPLPQTARFAGVVLPEARYKKAINLRCPNAPKIWLRAKEPLTVALHSFPHKPAGLFDPVGVPCRNLIDDEAPLIFGLTRNVTC
jgi:hypothetical protein